VQVDDAVYPMDSPYERRHVSEPVSARELAVVWALMALLSASLWLLPVLLR
jgi:hypothetical protein